MASYLSRRMDCRIQYCSVFFIAGIISGCGLTRPVPLPSVAEAVSGGDAVQLATQAKTVSLVALAPHAVDLSQPLSDMDIALLAVVGNRDLRAMRARQGVADAQVFSAGLLPDLQISASLDRPLQAGFVTAWSAALGFDLAALFGLKSARDEASFAARQVHYEIAWQEWVMANQARTLTRQYGYLRAERDLANAAAEVAEKREARMAKSIARHDARLDDAALAQIAALDARDREKSLSRQIIAARLNILALLGLPPGFDIQIATPTSLRPLDAVASATQLLESAVAERLDFLGLRAGYASNAAALRHARWGAFPFPTLGITRARDNSNVKSRGFSLGLSLPLWNRNRGAVRIAAATRAQLREEYSARLFQASVDLGTLLADLRAIVDERGALDARLPRLAQDVATLAQAVDRGDLPYLSYETVRAGLLDKQIVQLGLAQAEAEDEVALETATGKLLWKD